MTTTLPAMVDLPVRILLVDDKPEKLVALEALLSDLGAEIHKAGSGSEALRYLLKDDYALILLDVRMPVIDGFETAALIRQRPRCEHTPIIFLTANTAGETHVSRGYSLGAVDYMFAPIVPEVLRAKVAVFVDLYKKGQQVKAQAEWLREEAERRAAALANRLDALLDSLEVGVFRASAEGRLLEANPALLALLGCGPEAVAEGIDVKELQGDSDGATKWERDVLVARDGHSIWLSVSCTRVQDASGADVVDGLVYDITSRKRAEEELARKAEQLVRSNADLEQFAYIASHDLQEPLRTIHAYTSLLRQSYGEQLDERARMYLEFAADGAQRMQALVRDLLAFSRLRNEERPLAPVPCDSIVQRALFNLESAIKESEAEVEVADLPTVVGDEVLLVQLFQNLVGNAIKFRGEEPPKVRIEAEPQDGRGWTFTVKDNGIGIPKKHHERIFSMFRRLHARGRYEGSGMGLAICRHIVERHRGRIWVESDGGAGSAFRFTMAAE